MRYKNIHQETSLDKLQEYADKIEEMEDRNDPSDKESDIEDNKSKDSKENLNIRNDKNQMPQMKPTITNIQTFKNNVIDSRDLLFLRKDNIAYFVDINGKPLASGSQKLFERNVIPNLGFLTLGKAKVIKYKKYYHIALPISEEQREGPTMTMNQISTAIKDLRNTVDKLKLETLSIAKTDFVNNISWSNIKSLLQLTFIDSATKLIDSATKRID